MKTWIVTVGGQDKRVKADSLEVSSNGLRFRRDGEVVAWFLVYEEFREDDTETSQTS